MRGTMLAAVAAIAAAFPVAAQMDHPMEASTCAPGPVSLPEELGGWAERVPFTAAKDEAGARKAALTPGTAVDAALLQTSELRYALRPEKPGGSVSYGGLFRFSVKQAGVYRVALGSGAWIDVLRDGKAVESSAHGHGPDCSGIRKMVDFPLEPGDYLLQIAANGSPNLPLLVARRP